MIRGFLAVIVGFVLIVLCVPFGLFVAEAAFAGFFTPEEGSEVVPLTGTLIAQGLGLVSAVIGGFVAALIAGPARGAVTVLAVLVLALGLGHAVLEPTMSERLAANESRTTEGSFGFWHFGGRSEARQAQLLCVATIGTLATWI